MGKLLLWLKSLGVGNLPVYASVSLGLQVSVSTIQQSKINSAEKIIIEKAEEVVKKKSAAALVRLNEEGEFEIAGEVLSDLDAPLHKFIKESPVITAAPVVATVAANSAAARAPSSSSAPSALVKAPVNKLKIFKKRNGAYLNTPARSTAEKSKRPASTKTPTALIAAVILNNKDSQASSAVASSNRAENQPQPTSENTSSTGGSSETSTSTFSIADTNGGSELNTSTVSTDSVVSAVSDELYIAAVSYTDDSNSVNALNGLGLSWNYISSQCSNMGNVKVELWYASGIVAGDSVVTADLNSSSTSANIAVSLITGADLGLPYVGVRNANLNGVDGSASCGAPGTVSDSYEYEFDTLDAGSLIFSATAFSMNNTHTAGSMNERIELNSGGPVGLDSNLVVSDLEAASSDNYEIEGEFSGNVRWSSISLEIKRRP